MKSTFSMRESHDAMTSYASLNHIEVFKKNRELGGYSEGLFCQYYFIYNLWKLERFRFQT
ncbi:hypothetical protein LV84_03243 [Algoriphagus ratkowskyi]|uniref:Uncharacterized protein n=1 Tax=Algoriphagus ratkowskyi TaxID=57028 RepID=A0A2W7RGT6_9BACT|nr:hypothetical protein LV84_03243 [Algoriphagus ratkowskyi]